MGLTEGLKVFGRYRLLSVLGRNTSAPVWLARDTRTRRDRTLKFLPALLSSDDQALDELRGEIQRLRTLRSRSIARVYELAAAGNLAAVVMEPVDGKRLSALRMDLPGRVYDVVTLAPVVHQLCKALAYAQAKAQIVHGDLKSAALMLDPTSHIKVLDIGLSGKIRDLLWARGSHPSGTALAHLSPQQLKGASSTVSDDVYALGVTIYELLTGRPPFFRGELSAQIEALSPSPMSDMRKELRVRNDTPIPDEWERTVAACLEKKPEDRPVSPLAVWEKLSPKAASAKRRKRLSAAGKKRASVSPDTETGASLEAGAIGDSRMFDLGGGLSVTLCYVPGGDFVIGSPETEFGRTKFEDQVKVTLTSHFWIANTGCTQAQWGAFMQRNPSEFTGDDLLPVDTVSWEDAMAFSAALNAAVPLPAGWTFALPTEAQWERACRAGTTTVFSFGDMLTSKQANFDGGFPYGTNETGPFLEKTTPVGSYPANDYGLHDMHGNLWEWCADWVEKLRAGGIDPQGPDAGTQRIMRGGYFGDPGVVCRSANRGVGAPGLRIPAVGFRIALVRIVKGTS